ncbi:MAG: chemotaxis response regulator protein-glutamate methylesterase [Acidimicrobiales bacterium]
MTASASAAPTSTSRGTRLIRVLVVDDSAVIRRVVTDVLNDDADIEVVGTATNGRTGLEKFNELRPDLVTLDIEMPEMDGLAMLSALRKIDRQVPVVMFSSLTEKASAKTIEALSRGASDYVTKPSGHGSLADAMASVRAQMIPKVKALCPRSRLAPQQPQPRRVPGAPLPVAAGPRFPAGSPAPRAAAPTAAVPRGAASDARPRSAAGPVDIVAIGVSTGGPAALGQVVPKLKGITVPVVIVQHMPPMFTKLLAEQLSNSTGLTVVEGTNGAVAEPGKIYIAPGDFHMTVRREAATIRLELNQGAPENSCRPAVDPLFRSVASALGNRCLAVVLTGMGSDGEKGAAALREAGAQIIAQDQATSVVWGMPGAIARAGLADEILALGEIGNAIVTKVARRVR